MRSRCCFGEKLPPVPYYHAGESLVLLSLFSAGQEDYRASTRVLKKSCTKNSHSGFYTRHVCHMEVVVSAHSQATRRASGGLVLEEILTFDHFFKIIFSVVFFFLYFIKSCRLFLNLRSK